MDYYDEIAEGYNELHKEEQLKKLLIIKSPVLKLQLSIFMLSVIVLKHRALVLIVL